ncbi:MAG: septum formation initiator family protein [Alphaproteobacteria bacterium]|nr:septum formation initiator family protein [Alphaproteobacteria bacterium]
MMPRRTWQRIVSGVGICIVGYFLYHTVEGERGWVAQLHLQNETRAAQKTLTQLQKERETVERRVKLMRPDSLDGDLLDEEARKSLNYSKDGDIVILLPSDEDVGASTDRSFRREDDKDAP